MVVGVVEFQWCSCLPPKRMIPYVGGHLRFRVADVMPEKNEETTATQRTFYIFQVTHVKN